MLKVLENGLAEQRRREEELSAQARPWFYTAGFFFLLMLGAPVMHVVAPETAAAYTIALGLIGFTSALGALSIGLCLRFGALGQAYRWFALAMLGDMLIAAFVLAQMPPAA